MKMKSYFCLKTDLGMEAECAKKERSQIAEIAFPEGDIDCGFSKIKGTVVSFVRNLLSPYPSRKKELSAAAQTAGIGGNSALTLLVIGITAIVFGQQTAMAQTTPPAGTVNSPDSVLHGRTTAAADEILSELGPSITQYNQVTDLAQLSGITSLSFGGVRRWSQWDRGYYPIMPAITLPCEPATFKASPICKL